MPSSVSILLVEDSEDDVFTFRRTLKKAGVSNPLLVLTDGRQALEFFAAAEDPARSADHRLPFLLFLDLKLPYRDGFQVLEFLRGRPYFGQMAVVVLTGSDEPRDQQRAYALGARSYLTKPASVEDITRLLEWLRPFWEKIAGNSSPAAAPSTSQTRTSP